MLKLLTPLEETKAIDVLQHSSANCYDIVGTSSLIVQLQGLEIMNDDPTAVDVLYIKVKEIGSKRLLKLHEFLEQALGEAQLGSGRPEDSLKLHVTLAKSKFGDHSKRVSFDASGVLKAYADFDFGQYRLEGIHLSTRSEFDEQTGYWKSLVTIDLP